MMYPNKNKTLKIERQVKAIQRRNIKWRNKACQRKATMKRKMKTRICKKLSKMIICQANSLKHKWRNILMKQSPKNNLMTEMITSIILIREYSWIVKFKTKMRIHPIQRGLRIHQVIITTITRRAIQMTTTQWMIPQNRHMLNKMQMIIFQ